jgi:hypothetical protein
MQPNEITLVVDETNDGETTADVSHVYTRFEDFQNRSLYIGADHALTSRDTLGMYRSFPTPNGNFRGVAKTSFKFTEDVEVDGADGIATITAPMIIEVSCSFPVGSTLAQQMKQRQKALALLDLDDVVEELNYRLLT